MEITPLNKWIPNLKRPLVIAGPCSAESEEQVLETAKGLVEIEDVRIYRAGIWKPRTRPNTFEGVGEEGLPWLQKVKEQTGLLIAVEVATPKHVDLALKYGVDILWIGARTTVNPFAVQDIADRLRGTNIPVMVKNPINADLALWVGAIERISQAGITKMAAIHRGFSTAEKTQFRNQPMWRIPIELKQRIPGLPVICDPSHITGKRDMIAQVSQKAMDVDMDGLMIETHINPQVALSDAAQQVTPSSLHKIMSELSLKTEFSPDRNFEAGLDQLRSQIDRVDNEILEALKGRMQIVKKIGQAKVESNVTALQINRMDKMMKRRIEQAEELNLSQSYIKELYSIIHDHSVKTQTDIMIANQQEKSDTE
jgi:chorismate mutase